MVDSNNIQDLAESNESSSYHLPVLLHETIDGLAIVADGIYVDCTFGGGGHSRALLEKLGPAGKLFVFDQDVAAKQNLPADNRIVFIQQNFRYLQKFLRVNHCTQVDGILADLGVSSHQFDEPSRGFSIRFDATLDMRMDNRQLMTAEKIINTYSEQQLHKLFEVYGEVTNAKTLAKTIVLQRSIAPIKLISQFKQAVHSIVKGNPNKYFAQVFQALRIEVNDEMAALKEMLEQAVDVLKPGGRLAVITFHSLEDRMVKNFFKQGNFEDHTEEDVFGNRPDTTLKVLTKKPIAASDQELRLNSRSRSAKLRIAEKK